MKVDMYRSESNLFKLLFVPHNSDPTKIKWGDIEFLPGDFKKISLISSNREIGSTAIENLDEALRELKEKGFYSYTLKYLPKHE
jgi:hypothetical protein